MHLPNILQINKRWGEVNVNAANYSVSPPPSILQTPISNLHLLLRKSVPMEALWSLEDKWKLSTHQAALFLLVCTAFSVVVVCTAVTLKKKRGRRRQVVVVGEDVDVVHSMIGDKSGHGIGIGGCGWGSIKRLLMETVMWSGRASSRWEETQRPLPLLPVSVPVCHPRRQGDVGWQSHNSLSPVWQRPILMGEKCELPRFSGLILYDQTGQPLHQPQKQTLHQDKISLSRTTLRDLL